MKERETKTSGKSKKDIRLKALELIASQEIDCTSCVHRDYYGCTKFSHRRATTDCVGMNYGYWEPDVAKFVGIAEYEHENGESKNGKIKN